MNELAPIGKSQVRIESTNLKEDKAVVEKILLAAASKFNLLDNTHTSRVPETIKSIVEAEGFGLGARVVKNSIFADFNRRNDSGKFNEVHDFILSELRCVFQGELQEVWEDDPVYYKTH